MGVPVFVYCVTLTRVEYTRPRSSRPPSTAAPAAPRKLDGTELKAVRKCLDMIRSCHLKDGSIRMTGVGDLVWVEPHDGNLAALALLAARDVVALSAARKKLDLDFVRGWLVWYADHIEEPSGIVPAHEGTRGKKLVKIKDNVRAYNSVSACAGTYLLAVARFHRAHKKTPPRVIDAAVRSLRALEATTQEDGLLIAKADRPVKFLTNNVEAYAGLVEGGKFFEAVEREDDAEQAYVAADVLATAMQRFWQDDHYAWAIHQNRKAEGNLETPSQALANLFGLAYFATPRPKAWAALKKDFKPDRGPAPAIPVERWLIAARRSAPAKEVGDWRDRAVGEALKFDASLYVQRAAVMVLALVDGPGRFPQVLPPGME